MALMLLASVVFLATHLGISSTALRGRMVAALGERGYLGVYSLIALVTLGYLIWVYASLPRLPYLWLPSQALYLVPKLVMPVAAILLVGGFMVRNPTAVGQERSLPEGTDADVLTRGLTRVTRHPFQWAVVLWAGAHLIANGDGVSVIFFGTFLILGLVGGVLIDRKKQASLGAGWQPFAAVTSNVPFAAIAAGHNRLVLKELIAPILVGLVTYVGLFLVHPWLSGVRLV